MFNFNKPKFGTGCLPDQRDIRDLVYDEVAAVGEPVDWAKGFDIEKELSIKIPFKNQNGSLSCVGQAWGYQGAVIDAKETGTYKEMSAKAIYSQIFLSIGGGAYIRDGGKLITDWGLSEERIVTSYMAGKAPTEAFMTERLWKTPEIDKLAESLRAKEYRVISASSNMELFAQAIRDNYGVVGGLLGGGTTNTWNTFEPKPDKKEWGHALFFGKFGVDALGKYVATPNSWGTRGAVDDLHRDGWQKLRAEWFEDNFMFNPWTLVDKPNAVLLSADTLRVIKNNENKIVLEGEGHGRKGVIVNGKLQEITNERISAANSYVMANNNLGVTVPTKLFNEIPKDKNF